MTKVNGFIPTTLMLITLAFGATAANAGIIVGDRKGATTSTTTCEQPSTDSFLTSFIKSAATFARTGIIVGDRTGIIVGDRGGIIVGDRTSSSQETCGIIVGD
jgi:hypothetical protein